MRHVPTQPVSLISPFPLTQLHGLPFRARPLIEALSQPFCRPQFQKRSSSKLRPRFKENFQWSHKRAELNIDRSLRRFEKLTRFRTKPLIRPYYRSNDAKKMRSYVQFITTPTVDTPGTGLLLHFDDKRYFFGQMHEGLQRASLQRGSKLLKIREMFLTGKVESQTIGGLLGMILTLADANKSSLEAQKETQIMRRDKALLRVQEEEERLLKKTKHSSKSNKSTSVEDLPLVLDLAQEPLGIHGGPNIMHAVATARSFVFRQGMPLDVDEFEEGSEPTESRLDWRPTWEDENIKVWTMPTAPVKNEDGVIESTESNREQGVSKKRSHEDYVKGQENGEPNGSEPVQIDFINDSSDQAQKVREHVVHEMFRSSWRFDKLVETPLVDVNLPAKVFVRSPETNGLVPYDGPLPDGTAPVPDITVLVRKPWPGALITHLPPTRPSSTALSYIVRNQPQRGKFNVEKAKEFKVPPGPMFGQLARGESVTLADGRVVTPHQILEPGKEGGGVAIIDVPSRDYVLPLLSRREWRQESVMNGVEAFIWILGHGVAQDEMLISFMKEFKDLQHIVSSPGQCSNQLTMTSAASASVRHHVIDPDRYSLLQHDNTDASDRGTTAKESGYIMAKPGLKLQLEPSVAIEDDEVQYPVNLVEAVNDIPSTVYKLAKQAGTDAAQFGPEDETLPSPDAEIVSLGTGSALPSLYRNVSGTLLRVPGYGSYLLDVGENTLGQLKRLYTPKELADIFRDLKMIWISHLHADHHLGTAPMIKAWYHEVHGGDTIKRPCPSPKDQATKTDEILKDGRRLFVIGNKHMMRWLYEYSSVEDYGYDQLVPLTAKPATPGMAHLDRTQLFWNGRDVGFGTCSELSM